MAGGKGRDRRREAYWRSIVREQRGSGLTIREFCRKSKLRESAFYFWRRELERRDWAGGKAGREQRRRKRQRRGGSLRSPCSAAAPAFLPVTVKHEGTAAAPTGRIEIELSGGRRVRLTAPVDRQALADVLAALSLALEAPDRKGAAGQAHHPEGRPC